MVWPVRWGENQGTSFMVAESRVLLDERHGELCWILENSSKMITRMIHMFNKQISAQSKILKIYFLQKIISLFILFSF